MSVARTNILPVNLPTPNILDRRSTEAWILAVAQALRFRQVGRTTTSGGATSLLMDIQTEPDTVYGIRAYVVGRRTSGSGSVNDGYVGVLRGTHKVVSGTLSEVDEDTEFEETDIVGATSTFAVNGAKIELNVTGAAGYEMVWFGFMQTLLAK